MIYILPVANADQSDVFEEMHRIPVVLPTQILRRWQQVVCFEFGPGALRVSLETRRN